MKIQDFATDFLGGMLHVRWKTWSCLLFSRGESTTSSTMTRDYTISFEEFSTRHLHRDRVFLRFFHFLGQVFFPGSIFTGFLQVTGYVLLFQRGPIHDYRSLGDGSGSRCLVHMEALPICINLASVRLKVTG